MLLGEENFELVCGTNLDSNPDANITWTGPQGESVVANNGRYTLFNDRERVRLVINAIQEADMGTWTCIVRVDGIDVTTESGDVADTLIGSVLMHSIELTIVGKF